MGLIGKFLGSRGESKRQTPRSRVTVVNPSQTSLPSVPKTRTKSQGTARTTARQGASGTRPTARVRVSLVGILSALMWTGIGLAFALIPMGIYQGWVSLVQSGELSITEIRVTGNERLSEADIITVAGIEPGLNYFDVDSELIIDRLKSNPWIRDVVIEKKFPSSIAINITERVPYGLLVDENTCLIDQDSTVFKIASPDEYDAGLLILSGMNYYKLHTSGMARLAMERVSYAMSLAHQYATAGLGKYAVVTEVRFDESLGFSLITDQDQEIVFGFDNESQKTNRLASILAELDNRKQSFASIHLDNERRPSEVVVTGTTLLAKNTSANVAGKAFSGSLNNLNNANEQ